MTLGQVLNELDELVEKYGYGLRENKREIKISNFLKPETKPKLIITY
jgi:hypothetical protein